MKRAEDWRDYLNEGDGMGGEVATSHPPDVEVLVYTFDEARGCL